MLAGSGIAHRKPKAPYLVSRIRTPEEAVNHAIASFTLTELVAAFSLQVLVHVAQVKLPNRTRWAIQWLANTMIKASASPEREGSGKCLRGEDSA